VSDIRIGISGWRYQPWRGVFYPASLRQKDELAFASQVFNSIELNGSFYSLQRPSSYQAWHDAVPEDFVFAIKGSRYVTHMLRLQNARTALANFFASGLLCLANKLGPILWQLPPAARFEPDRLRAFLDLLPRNTREVEALARQHDARLRGRSVVDAISGNQPIRYAFEVRHPSFESAGYTDILRDYGVASCVADSAGLYPTIDAPTASFSYARLHGKETLYVSGYEPTDLRVWARRVRRWRKRGDVFVYFDNDVKVRAPFDAQNLTRLLARRAPLPLPDALGGVTEEPRTVWPQWRAADSRLARSR
jgi:uncharacterized protein YecE (DUF72 family)